MWDELVLSAGVQGFKGVDVWETIVDCPDADNAKFEETDFDNGARSPILLAVPDCHVPPPFDCLPLVWLS